MKVAYDISWLGYLAGKSSGPTGLERVVERLAIALANSGECDLSLCAGDSFAAAGGAVDYWRRHPELKQIRFAYNASDAVLRFRLHHLQHRLNQKEHLNALEKAARRAIPHLCELIDRPDGPLAEMDVELADIYHSPFTAIPNEVREISSRLKVFLTCYDLIPILHPLLSPAGAPETLRNVLDSLREGDFVCCISAATRDDLCNHVPWLDSDHVFVTYLAADTSFRPVSDKSLIEKTRRKYQIPEQPYFLMLGSLQPRKGMEHTIRCIQRLLNEQRDFDCYLVIAGARGWKDESIFEALHRDPRLAQRVFVTGRIADEDLASLYSGAEAFVFPSLYEGFGLPVLEAMQCGAPVIASNTSSLPEVVGEAGILIAPRDVDALCQAMLDVSRRASLRANLRVAGLNRAAEFSWKRCAQETIAAYRAALTEPAAAVA